MREQNEARETAGRRVESARETVRRRAEGDLRDAAERLVEERNTFKSQLGAAHADILRLGAETAELERQNRELVLARTEESPLDWRNSPEGTPGGRKGGGRKGAVSSASGMIEGGQSSAGVRHCLGDVENALEEGKRERALRVKAEEEREALRRMCNGLAVDLKAAVEARADAEDDREALVQVITGEMFLRIVWCLHGQKLGHFVVPTTCYAKRLENSGVPSGDSAFLALFYEGVLNGRVFFA